MSCLPSRSSRDQLAFWAAIDIALQYSKLQAYPWNQTLVSICFYLANRAQEKGRKSKLEMCWQERVVILKNVTVSVPQTIFSLVSCRERLLKAIFYIGRDLLLVTLRNSIIGSVMLKISFWQGHRRSSQDLIPFLQQAENKCQLCPTESITRLPRFRSLKFHLRPKLLLQSKSFKTFTQKLHGKCTVLCHIFQRHSQKMHPSAFYFMLVFSWEILQRNPSMPQQVSICDSLQIHLYVIRIHSLHGTS